MKPLFPFAAALLALALAGCSPQDGGGGKSSRQSMSNATGQPTAKISADGDFTVGGKPVAVDDAQRALLVAYHRELGAVADAGIATGKEGAKLAGKAVGAAIKGVFSGKPEGIEHQVRQEADKVKVEALKICDRLPPLYQAQQALAAALPEFRPTPTWTKTTSPTAARTSRKTTFPPPRKAHRPLQEGLQSRPETRTNPSGTDRRGNSG